MSVQDAVASALPEFRRQAESRMTSRCAIHRTGGTTTNAQGFKVAGLSTVATDAPVRIGSPGGRQLATRRVSVGNTEVQVATRTASLPWDTADLRDNDLLEMTSGELAGRWFRVIESTPQEQATALRVPVVEVSAPEGA